MNFQIKIIDATTKKRCAAFWLNLLGFPQSLAQTSYLNSQGIEDFIVDLGIPSGVPSLHHSKIAITKKIGATFWSRLQGCYLISGYPPFYLPSASKSVKDFNGV